MREGVGDFVGSSDIIALYIWIRKSCLVLVSVRFDRKEIGWSSEFSVGSGILSWLRSSSTMVLVLQET